VSHQQTLSDSKDTNHQKQ